MLGAWTARRTLLCLASSLPLTVSTVTVLDLQGCCASQEVNIGILEERLLYWSVLPAAWLLLKFHSGTTKHIRVQPAGGSLQCQSTGCSLQYFVAYRPVIMLGWLSAVPVA